jgi:hypothetical protein
MLLILTTLAAVLYGGRLGFANLDSARQSQMEAKRPNEEDHSRIGKADEEDPFGKAAASPNSQNLSDRRILPSDNKENEIAAFLKKYPTPVYQDVLIENRVVAQGTNICASRYEMIKPIFAHYHRPFKVLEVGAAQGYFSFRIAHDFPQAFCTMIEEDNPYYSYHGTMLYDLCCLNSHLNNLCLLKKHLSIEDLQYLNTQEHFDVVMAFLVIHQMETNLDKQIQIFDTLLHLGNNLILEVCDDAALELTLLIEYLSKKNDCHYLGSVKRFYDPKAPHIGKMFWFKKKDEAQENNFIKRETFEYFNGVYP